MRKKIDLLTAAGSHIWTKKGGFSAKKPRIENQTFEQQHAKQKNQLKEQLLEGISDKQLARKIDAALEQLISNEIDLTVKELSTSIKKKEQKVKQEQEVEQ